MPSITVFAATTGVNDATVGTLDWTSISAVNADDGNEASVTLNVGISKYLRAAPQSLSAIPIGAIINGITVTVAKHRGAGGLTTDNSVKLYKSGIGFVGNDKAIGSGNWPTSETNFNYGGSTDKWGTTWTRDEIVNDLQLGFSAVGALATSAAFLDFIKFTIDYTDSIDETGKLSDITLESDSVKELTTTSDTPAASDAELESAAVTEVDLEIRPSEVTLESVSVKEQFALLYQLASSTARPGEPKPYPVTFLELGDLSDKPFNEPTPGRYLGKIKTHPDAENNATETVFGVRTYKDMQISIANKGDVFTAEKEIRNLRARVWRQDPGAVAGAELFPFGSPFGSAFGVMTSASYKKIFVGKVGAMRYGRTVTLILKDLIREAFFSTMPMRKVTTDSYPKAKDLGALIPIASGRCSRLGPLPLIEYDEAARIFRYACGEGTGYGGGHWGQIFTAYFGEVAFKKVTGTAAAGTAGTLTLEAADRRPADFYKWQWVHLPGQTPKFVTTSDDVTKVTISGSFDSTPGPGTTYEIRPWRFYDGSQASPYPDLALLEFKFPITDGSTFAPVFADSDALQAERNVVRMIQSLLGNLTWGKGLVLNSGEFDAAAALPEIVEMLCEGRINEERQLIDILTEILQWRNIELTDTELGIGIKVDTLQNAPKAYYSLGDRRKENILANSLADVFFVDSDRVVKNVTAFYRFDDFLDDFIQKGLVRQANVTGEDRELKLNFVYDHETADRILDFRRKFYRAEAKEWGFSGRREADLARNDRINVVVNYDGMKISSDWRVRSIAETQAKDQRGYAFGLIPYPEAAFTYEPAAELPADEDFPVPPKFDDTPPDPLAGAAVSYVKDFNAQGQLLTYAVLTFTPPAENYHETVARIRKTGDTNWDEGGRGTDRIRIPVTPGLNYDYELTPYNSAGTAGLATVIPGSLVTGDTTIPKPPTGVTGHGKLNKVWWEFVPPTQNTDNSALQDLKEIQYRIWTAATGGTQLYPSQGGGAWGVTTERDRHEISDQDGDMTTQKRNLYAEFRAGDNSGNASTATSRVLASTGEVQRKDIKLDDITKVFDDAAPGEQTAFLSEIVSVTITPQDADSKIEIWGHFSAKNNNVGPSSGATYALRKNGSNLQSKAEVHRGLTDQQTTAVPFHYIDDNPGTGAKTYSIEHISGDTQTVLAAYISVEELER